MKTISSILFVLLLTMIVIPVVEADGGPTIGAVEAGYIYRGGYWYDGAGNAYTRAKVYWGTPSYTCGYGYSYPYWYWSYTQAYPAATVTTYNTVNYDALEQELIKISAQRERHQQFLDKVTALGLQYSGQYLTPRLGSAGYGNGNVNVGSFGTNGNTIYGYSYSSLADVYGSTDMNVLFQQSAALARNGQDLGGQATQQFNGLIDKVNDGRNREREILAQGKAAEVALNAAKPQGQATVTTQENTTIVTPTVDVGPSQPVVQQVPRASAGLSRLQLEAANYCIKCHGATTKTGYRVLDHWRLPASRQREVVRRLVQKPSHADFMPKGGSPVPSRLIMVFMPQNLAARVEE